MGLIIMSSKINDEKGISGWLSDNGEFIPVTYGEHSRIADGLELQIVNKHNLAAHGERLFELLGYIKFVCKYSGACMEQSYVFFAHQFGYTGEVTTEQFEWIYANLDNMSERQRLYCKDYLRYYYESKIR